MNWFLPRSLTGQIALVMTAALLVASAVNFGILMSERQRSGLIEQTGPSMARFVDLTADLINSPPPKDVNPRALQLRGRNGPARYSVTQLPLIDTRGIARSDRLEQRLQRVFDQAEVKVDDIRAAQRTLDRPERTRLIANPFPGQRPFGGGPFAPGLPGPGGPPADAQLQPAQPLADGAGATQQPAAARQIDPPFGAGNPGGPVGPGPGGGPRPGDFQGGGPFRGDMASFDGQPPRPREVRELVLAAQLTDGRWLNASVLWPVPPTDDFFRLGASTFILFVSVLAAALWVASRLSRPLRDLAHAAEGVGSAGEPQEVSVRGPSDVRSTLEAFNAMSRRVSQLLGEKDVMLGALGHDLRTPLSSLRIRLESMEPESERNKAVKTIEETVQLLEDILQLARQGKSSEPLHAMDVSILVEDLAEDYAETGAPVRLVAKQRTPIAVRPAMFRRLLRNLIDNAISYGKTATLSVAKEDRSAVIRVEDEGPGLSQEEMAGLMQPFVRGDVSRNRRTGGAGLGLALADAIAKAHGGELKLENRKEGGLAAIVRIPLAFD